MRRQPNQVNFILHVIKYLERKNRKTIKDRLDNSMKRKIFKNRSKGNFIPIYRSNYTISYLDSYIDLKKDKVRFDKDQIQEFEKESEDDDDNWIGGNL